MLTPRQLETIENIAKKGITTPEAIIAYCLKKKAQPRKINYAKHPNSPRKERRRHSRKYFEEIINHYGR